MASPLRPRIAVPIVLHCSWQIDAALCSYFPHLPLRRFVPAPRIAVPIVLHCSGQIDAALCSYFPHLPPRRFAPAPRVNRRGAPREETEGLGTTPCDPLSPNLEWS